MAKDDKDDKPKREIDDILIGETHARVSAARSAKIRGDYVKRDEHGRIIEVRCRLCGTPIFMDGQVLGNYRNVEFRMSSGAVHRSNGCADCVDGIERKDEAFLEAFFCSDIEAWARSDVKNDRTGRKGVRSAVEHEAALGQVHKAKIERVIRVVYPGAN